MARRFLGQDVALYGCACQRFVQMRPDGTVGSLDDAACSPGNLEVWRTWERFLVVDAGNGEVALHNALHNRFIRVWEGAVEAHGGPMDADKLPGGWESERFTIVDAGNGKWALHNAHHYRFIRMHGAQKEVDAGGGPRDRNRLPPEADWASERFLLVPHPLADAAAGGARASHALPTSSRPFPSDYEHMQDLAEGYHGKTCKAVSRVDHGTYCVKEYKRPLKDVMHEVTRELRALVALPSHANIVKYHHATEVDGKLFTICEFIDGHQLDRAVPLPDGKNPLFVEASVVSWARQMFLGLKGLHSGDTCIIHRDLHLGNVLVRRLPEDRARLDTGPGSIKIIDVGNSSLERDHEVHVHSDPGGTLAFFSPERLAKQPYNEKEDVWAVACMLTELVTGRRIKNRSWTGEHGHRFATDEQADRRNEVVAEVRARSARLGDVVGAIFAGRQASTRPSAEDILSTFFDHPSARPPRTYVCSITQELLADPVVCVDGHSYSRAAIEDWFQRGHRTSPITNLPLYSTVLTPNHELRAAIEEWRQQTVFSGLGN